MVFLALPGMLRGWCAGGDMWQDIPGKGSGPLRLLGSDERDLRASRAVNTQFLFD